jgi:hypothetical protein
MSLSRNEQANPMVGLGGGMLPIALGLGTFPECEVIQSVGLLTFTYAFTMTGFRECLHTALQTTECLCGQCRRGCMCVRPVTYGVQPV